MRLLQATWIAMLVTNSSKSVDAGCGAHTFKFELPAEEPGLFPESHPRGSHAESTATLAYL